MDWKESECKTESCRVCPSPPSPRSSHVCWNFPHRLRGILLRKLQRLARWRKAFYGHGSGRGQRAGSCGEEEEEEGGSQDKQRHGEPRCTSKKGRIASVSVFFFCVQSPCNNVQQTAAAMRPRVCRVALAFMTGNDCLRSDVDPLFL